MPFFFGEGTRRLFGVYEPATSDAGRPRAAVLCAPWGPDHVVSYASLRRLAAYLAASGRHTLRFDYFGMGDSAGETEDADIDGWRQDIDFAIDEIKSMVEATHVTLIGLRVGANLAAEVAARRKDVNALVLWDPVVRGAAYLDEMRAEHREFVRERSRYSVLMPTDEPNLCGFPFPSRVEAQLEALDLVALAPRLKQKILFIGTGDLGHYDEAIASLGKSASLVVENVHDVPPWLQDRLGFGGGIPNEALRKITAWAN